MFTRQQRFISSVIVLALVFAFAPVAFAKGKGFKDVVKHIETKYRAKKTKIPFLGLAGFAVKLIRPAGVKGFKLAVFEDRDFSPREGEASFISIMREAYTAQKGWKPLVQTHSRREGQNRAFIFIKENKKDVEVAVTTLAEREAVVIEVKFSPDKLVQFLDNPRIMGISLGKSLRGQTDNAIAGAITGNGNSTRPLPPAKPSEPSGASIQIIDRTGELAAVDAAAVNASGHPANNNSGNPTVTATAAVNKKIILKGPEDLSVSDENNPPVKEDELPNDAAAAPAPVIPRDPNAIRIETRLVNLNVRALNKTGLPLTELKPEDFTIFEDEAKQEVAYFKPVNAPVNLLIMLDMSGSTQKRHKAMIESVRKFIDLLPANDKMSIVAFTRKYYRLSGFTSDKRALKLAVEKIKNIRGGTAYYDAMVEALSDLNKLGDARKAIVVLTDGEDESMFGSEPTGYSFGQLLEHAAESDVTVYPIYFNGADQYRRLSFIFSNNASPGWQNERQTIARKQMHELADQTGGEVVNAQTEGDLAGAYARVANELHTIYSLAYLPDKLKHDGSFRKITVKVNREGALAKTRKGYYDK